MSAHLIQVIDSLFGDRQTSIAKDLKLNLKRLLEDSALSSEEAILAVIATARTLDFSALVEAGREAGAALGLSADVLREAEENAAIMAMLNVYYRFRHFIEHEDPEAKDAFGPAKLRMTSLANPSMGKERFEMLAFAVSCLNGCERCVASHDKALTSIGVGRDKIHDLGRLAAVVAGLRRLWA